MGRRFTAASSERIVIGTAATLMGCDFRFGTMAACFYRVSDPGGAETFIASNAATGASFDFTIAGGGAPDNLDLFDGTVDRQQSTTTLATGKNYIGVITKATGTATGRGHLCDFGAGTWTHTAMNGTSVDGALVTALALGSYQDASASDALDSEVWAIGLWNKLVMTDSQVQQLSAGNWASMEPTFYVQFSDGREFGDMGYTQGRFPARQSGRTGTTRGVQKPPPGFRLDARVRRR